MNLSYLILNLELVYIYYVKSLEDKYVILKKIVLIFMD
jgi:hypothetical protein